MSAPAHYSRFCPHCGANMSVVMRICPVCHKANTAPTADAESSGVQPGWIAGGIGGLVVLVLLGNALSGGKQLDQADSSDDSSQPEITQTVRTTTGTTPVDTPETAPQQQAPEPEAPAPSTASSQGSVDDLDVQNLGDEAGIDGGSMMGYVKGTVVNKGNHNFAYVQVEINLYDSSGNQLGSTMANVNNLEPLGRWNFKAAVAEEHVARYKVVNITGW